MLHNCLSQENPLVFSPGWWIYFKMTFSFLQCFATFTELLTEYTGILTLNMHFNDKPLTKSGASLVEARFSNAEAITVHSV